MLIVCDDLISYSLHFINYTGCPYQYKENTNVDHTLQYTD